MHINCSSQVGVVAAAVTHPLHAGASFVVHLGGVDAEEGMDEECLRTNKNVLICQP